MQQLLEYWIESFKTEVIGVEDLNSGLRNALFNFLKTSMKSLQPTKTLTTNVIVDEKRSRLGASRRHFKWV